MQKKKNKEKNLTITEEEIRTNHIVKSSKSYLIVFSIMFLSIFLLLVGSLFRTNITPDYPFVFMGSDNHLRVITRNNDVNNITDIKETDIQFTGDTGAKVSFSAVINNHEASNLVTRATETNWEAEDSVGITCGTEQVNIHYKYKGNGLFAAKGRNAEEIWVLGSGEYDVVAYAPFSGTSGEEQPVLEVTTASDNQATAEERAKIDFLFAKGKATSQTPNVTLAFNHVMSRIRLEFQAGEGVDLADITCYLIGLKNNGTFNPKTGETTVSEDPVTDKDDIYWDKIGEQDNYTVQAILLPQKVQGKVTIQARMNGYLYEAEFANLTELKSGFSYNYIIKTNKYEDNNYVLTITEQTQIIGWEDENHDPITSDPSIAETGTEITNPSWNITEETVTPQPVVK